MTFDPSPLSGENILRDVHDVASQSLRTTAVASIIIPPNITVAVSHTEDSVRLGDGSAFITSTGAGTKNALDVFPVTAASNLNVSVLSMPLNTSIYTFVIPAQTKKFSFRSRLNGALKINFNTTITSSNYFSVPAGSYFYEDGLLLGLPITLYVQSTKNGDTLEILTVS